MAEGVGGGDCGSEDEGGADDEQAGEGDVGVGVGDALEDGVVLEEEVESADVDIDGEDEEQEEVVMERPRQGEEPKLRRCLLSARAPLVTTRKRTARAVQMTARVSSQLMMRCQRGEGEEEEADWLAEDGVGGDGCGYCVPEEGECGPLFHHGGAGDDGDEECGDRRLRFRGRVRRRD